VLVPDEETAGPPSRQASERELCIATFRHATNF
jgi:hypothetical protein